MQSTTDEEDFSTVSEEKLDNSSALNGCECFEVVYSVWLVLQYT